MRTVRVANLQGRAIFSVLILRSVAKPRVSTDDHGLRATSRQADAGWLPEASASCREFGITAPSALAVAAPERALHSALEQATGGLAWRSCRSSWTRANAIRQSVSCRPWRLRSRGRRRSLGWSLHSRFDESVRRSFRDGKMSLSTDVVVDRQMSLSTAPRIELT